MKPPRHRRLFQLGFFAFFLVAPWLDWLRFDLHETQLWVAGQRWSLGIEAFRAGRIGADEAALGLVLKAFVPALLLVGAFLAVAWRWGRVYCGWLCPHFSMVELLNGALHRACAKWSLWDARPSPRDDRRPQPLWWPVFAAGCALGGFVWAFTALAYLLPPRALASGLWQGTLAPGPTRFLAVGWALFTAEFALARHLFCRFGCAVGLFQSLVWMANPRGLVVAFDRDQARDCRSCATARHGHGSACDRGCPMRLHPRNIKRMMFSCVQCGQCLEACAESQGTQGRAPLLEWKVGVEAVRETLRQRQAERGPSPADAADPPPPVALATPARAAAAPRRQGD